MRRFLALLAAAAMVAGAVVARNVIDDDSTAAADDPTGSDTSASTGPDRPQGTGDDPERIRCATELQAACRSLGSAGFTVSTEPAGTTARDLIALAPGDDAGFDVWLTAAPWPAIVEEQRGIDLAGPILDDPVPLGARSPVVIVSRADRTDVLAQTCTMSWACVGDHIDSSWEALGGSASWGRIKPGHAPPDVDTEGLLSTAQLTADYLGTTTYASNDLDVAYNTWLGALERAVPDHTPAAGTPLDQMLLASAFYDMVGSIEATAAPLVAASRDRGALTITVPEPIVTADAVAVAVAGDGAASTIASRDDVRAALAEAGWRVEGHPAAATIDSTVTLPESDNLPPAGVLIALTDRWHEVT